MIYKYTIYYTKLYYNLKNISYNYRYYCRNYNTTTPYLIDTKDRKPGSTFSAVSRP